jgi:outer membrane receptor protein involved in Fe transport
VDATNKTIQFADGSKPLVLVNGVNRPGYINSLDPADIESVEIISNPSARYRGEQSVTGIINLKVKRKKQTYTIGNFSTRHDPGLVYGVTNGSFEVGNSKSSLYMVFFCFVFSSFKCKHSLFIIHFDFFESL